MKEWCYLNIDEIYAMPHEVKLMQSEINIEVSLHEGWCSSYITLCHNKFGLQIGDKITNILFFRKTIAVPVYNKEVMRKILSTDFKLQVLIGENRIYRSFDVQKIIPSGGDAN